jgi:Threonyl and Alanyl tRNA synthetase second additional domain
MAHRPGRVEHVGETIVSPTCPTRLHRRRWLHPPGGFHGRQGERPRGAAWSYGTPACRSPGQHGTPDRLPDVIRIATNLVPSEVKDVRIVDIVGLGQEADGGTRVASTRQVGRIQVVKVENKDEGFRRLRIRVAD